MDKVKAIVKAIKGEIEAIETELTGAENTGKVSYPRSKNVRKSAMEIIKAGRELRIEILAEFKAGQKKTDKGSDE